MFFQRCNKLVNENRVIRGYFQIHTRWQVRPDVLFQTTLDFFDDVHRIGVGDLDHAQADSRFAVVASDLAVIGDAVFDCCYVLKANRYTGIGGNNEFAQRPDIMKLHIQFQ